MFVCVECGGTCDDRPELMTHWREEKHGPRQVQADAVDRSVAALEGPEAADARKRRARLRVIDGDGG